MKCKVLCFLLCVSFCFILFSLSSSAADVLSPDELIQYGYIFDGDCYYLPKGYPDPYMSYAMSLVSPEKNYPNFDPKKIPWSSAPSYIQDIIYMSMDGALASDYATYKVPFVLIRVAGSTAIVYVGINCGLGYDVQNDRMRVCCTEQLYNYSVCYQANFNINNYSTSMDWIKLTQSVWGTSGVSKVKSYTSTLAYPTSNYDFYFYGGNGVRIGTNVTSVGFALYGANSGDCVFPIDNEVGFQNGRFFFRDTESTSVYCQYFVPPTPEEVEQETQKGIWDTLKSIPETIAEKFKGLFIPSEGFFDTYTAEFQDYFKDRFGLLYELPDAMIGIFQQFINFEPATEGYYIPIPEVVLPVRLEDGSYEDFVIFEEQDYEFDFLSEGAIGTLYKFYRSFVWLISILALISLAIRKYNKITGGGG